MSTSTAPVTRPKTCGQLAIVSPELGEAKCKRLPRHKGDHRATLHFVRPSRTTAKPSKASKQALFALLAGAVEDGSMTPAQALAKASAFLTRKTVATLVTEVAAAKA